MRALPTGTVTFLFTDIEGATRLLQQLGNSYPDVLEVQRRLLQERRTGRFRSYIVADWLRDTSNRESCCSLAADD